MVVVMSQFQRQQSDDFDLQQMQSNLESVSKQSFSSEIVQGVLLTGIAIRQGSTVKVDHTLGRAWKGFMIVNNTPISGFLYSAYYDDTVTANKTLTIPLQGMGSAGARATISLWVF
tara:strand:+ start:1619 stop:1966 length:348 start_codon:yes stop_codon:yes gene_type:complete